MKKSKVIKLTVLGILCLLYCTAAGWHAYTYNNGRILKPMDYSAYVFNPTDIPMIVAVILAIAYVVFLIVSIVRALITYRKGNKFDHTRKISPALGFAGFLGFLGFLGIWTYKTYHEITPFFFFSFFGFFGFYFEGKLSNTLMDERFREDYIRAKLNAYKTGFTVMFIGVFLGAKVLIDENLEAFSIFMVIIFSLVAALIIFLSEYLLYRYDHDEQNGE